MKLFSRISFLLGLVLMGHVDPSHGSMDEVQIPLRQTLADHNYSELIMSVADRFEKKLDSAHFAHVPKEEMSKLREDLRSLLLYTCETSSPEAMAKSPYANVGVEKIDQLWAGISERMLRYSIYSNPYLYELTGPDGKKIYLIGSNHITPLENIPPAVKIIMDSCAQVWFEIDFSKEKAKSDLQWQYDLYKSNGFANTPQSDWIGSLKPENASVIKKFTDDFREIFGVDYQDIHPAFYLRRNSFDVRDQDQGVDAKILETFVAANKPRRFLETAKDVLHPDTYIQSLSEDKNLPMDELTQKLNQFIHKLTNSANRAFGHLSKLLYILDILTPEETRQAFAGGSNVDRRNLIWMSVLDEALKGDAFNKPNFMCMGLGHLTGPLGMLPYFINQGFEIKRMDREGKFSITCQMDETGEWIESAKVN